MNPSQRPPSEPDSRSASLVRVQSPVQDEDGAMEKEIVAERSDLIGELRDTLGFFSWEGAPVMGANYFSSGYNKTDQHWC